MEDRERWLADTLVELADSLVTDFDVIDLLSTLAERLQELIEASEVGLLIADPQGHLRVMASSSERARLIELFEAQSHEGPCWDSYRSQEAVLNVDLRETLERWPVFTPMARTAGYRTVHALPMRLRDEVIGAANIFHSTLTTISDPDVHLAQALADVATIGILQERAVRHGVDLSAQLQQALDSRVTVEQAKGAIAERAGVDMDTAFNWLRGYSRANSLRMAEVAIAIVDRTLPVEVVRSAQPARSDLPQA